MGRNEKETREQLIDPKLLLAGWPINHTNGVVERNHACVETKVTHMPITEETPNGNGYVDYVLFGDDGKPLALIEAKKSVVNEERGRTQACLYADCLEKEYGVRPIVYYTNGYTIKCIDGVYPPRTVFSFHSREDLEYLIQKRGRTFSDRVVRQDICDRYYQIEAINKVLDHIQQKNARSLIVLATGTGKTRVSCALSDIFIRNNFVKRILFLADRKNLVKQAKEETFDIYLPDVPKAMLMEGRREEEDSHARIVFATYQSMLSIIQDVTKNPYSVGYFDLIIVDEAHRSLFNKYAEIFDYFDSLMIGLTATPRNDIHHSTYKVFNLDDDVPNYEYDIIKGVKDGYLTYFRALDRTPDILKNGLVYKNLSEDEKEKYEDLFTDEDDNIPESVEGKLFYSTITNIDTIKKMLKDLMDEGLYVQNGDVLGKTIVFAKNVKHAHKIVECFRQLYPQLCVEKPVNGVDYCVVVANDEPFNDVLQREFKTGEHIRIVVSVDMMDTGVDIPDLVNLVFFKKVLSKIKFWQMIGRGTRTFKSKGLNVLSPSASYFERKTDDGKRTIYTDKQGFLIFDFCNVFEFFGEHPNGIEHSSSDLSLSQHIFLSKVKVLKGMQADYASLGEKDRAYYQSLKEDLLGTVKSLSNNYIGVQTNLEYVEKYRKSSSWDNLGQPEYAEIVEHLAFLIPGTLDIESAKRFDWISYEFMNSRHDHSVDGARIAKLLYKLIAKGLLETKLHISEVKLHEETLRRVTSDEFLNHATPSDIEDVRLEVRDLTRYIEPDIINEIITDFRDKILILGDADKDRPFSVTEFKSYRERAMDFVKSHIGEGPYAKIYGFEELKKDDYDSIKHDLEGLDAAGFGDAFPSLDNAVTFIRKTLGLSDTGISNFLSEEEKAGFSGNQISYIREMLKFISENGDITREDLLNPDLDFSELFNSKEINDVFDALKKHGA